MRKTVTEGPLQRYGCLLETGALLPDPGQALAVATLDDLFQRVLAAHSKTTTSRWQALLGGLGLATNSHREPVRGLYMWGGVGRGKTLLMDLFFDALPFDAKMRLHFHRFMREVHRSLNKHSGSANPLRQVADEFAASGSILCFDEFFVSDIGDAMILGELLAALFERGVALVATSNVEPVRLYENGLQRSRFLPAIDLLHQHVEVLNVDGGVDYRLRVLERAEIYHVPLDAAAVTSLTSSFDQLAGAEPVTKQQALVIEGRPILAKACAGGVVWFDFVALCDGPRSQNDYIELARLFHTVLVEGVPQLTRSKEDQARRFISLVDEFYDRGVKLIISAAVPVERLYQGERLGFEFERTQSRLLEMRSYEYLAREHRA